MTAHEMVALPRKALMRPRLECHNHIRPTRVAAWDAELLSVCRAGLQSDVDLDALLLDAA